jgi:hypothetical protein
MTQKPKRRRSERRERPRADARLSMRVESAPENEGVQIVTESQNISSSGVYCTSSHYLAPLSKVALTIVLPKLPGGRSAKELIKCEGIVVRCQGLPRKSERAYELACMFSGLDERRRNLLDEFVVWRNLQSLRAAARAVNGRRRSAAGAGAKSATKARASRARKTAKRGAKKAVRRSAR